ncbi:MAG: biotin/lipoate A/B protein ligase family protein [Bacteroidota bacterium]
MSSPWHFIDTGENTGAYNMAFDMQLAHDLSASTGAQTLRLYRWKPWAISLGHNQLAADVDRAKCTDDGIEVVRRPTGGRAILHAEELTYSVVMLPQGSINEMYCGISSALVRGLELFGVNVDFQRTQPKFATIYRAASSAACFTSSARYEIEWKGRKLVGSAQRRLHDRGQEVVLQHGSILVGPEHRRLVEYLSNGNPEALNHLKEEMEHKTIDLQTIMDRQIDIVELALCIRRGFEMEWNVEFTEQRTNTENQHA